MRKHEQVAASIRVWIGDGRFGVGERLPGILEIARELGVSDQPVRVAVRRLVAEGVLDARKGSGIYVSEDRVGRRRVMVDLSSLEPAGQTGGFCNWYQSAFAAGLARASKQRNVELRYHYRTPSTDVGRLLSFYHGADCSGVILANGGRDDLVDSLLEEMEPWRIVRAGIMGAPGRTSQVDPLIEPGLAEMLRRVCELGHRRAAFLYGRNLDVCWTHLERFRIFVKLWRKLGWTMNDVNMIETGGDAIDGYRATLHLLKSDPAVSFIFACTDERAKGVCQALEDSGLRVGVDVSVAGYDGMPMSEELDLATVSMPCSAYGERALEVLLNSIALGRVIRDRSVQTRFVERRSLGAAPRVR